MAVTEDLDFFPKMVALSQCLCAELTVRELPEPCFCGVIPGANSIADYCIDSNGKNGMAYVRLVGIAEIETERGFSVCGQQVEAVIEVGVLRCSLTLHEDGTPPTAAEQLEATRIATADMAASLAAIRCCYPNNRRDVRVMSWQPVGPSGGCVGGAWNVVIQSG